MVAKNVVNVCTGVFMRSILIIFVLLFLFISPLPVFALSSNSYLENLGISGYEITPIFRKTTLVYQVGVSQEVERLVVEATPEDAAARVDISGNANLIPGRNTIKVQVVAQDGSTTDYRVVVLKAGEVSSDNAYLAELVVPSHTLFPTFQEEVFQYTLDVRSDIQQLDVVAIPVNESAKVAIEGNKDLVPGSNLITITVTSFDGSAQQSYIVNVLKPDPVDERSYQWYTIGRIAREYAGYIIAGCAVFMVSIGLLLWRVAKKKLR